MTISTLTTTTSAIGNGLAIAFPYTFAAMADDEVAVTIDGAIVPPSLYTVTRNVGDEGGTVTFYSAPATGAAVRIFSDPDFQQDIAFTNAGPFLAASFDEALDRAAVRTLYLKDQVDRSFRVPPGETLADLPSLEDRAGKYVAFDALGDPVASGGTGVDASLRTDLATATGGGLIGFLQAGIGAIARTIRSKLLGIIEFEDYGAVGDGVTNDQPAIMAAIAANPGGYIRGKTGKSYLLNSAVRIIDAPVTLDFKKSTLVLGTTNIDGIVIGDGTEAGKNATLGTLIKSPTFNVKAGVAAFTTGSCIFRNYTAFVNVENLLVYGRDGATTKLYNGVYDYMASECDTPNAVIQWVSHYAVHCKGDGTLAGRTVDCNYDNLRATDIFTAIYVDVGCAGLGFYRPTIYGLFAGGRGIHINTTAGPMGQNFFIDTPDIEAGATTDAAIWLQSGQKAIINGGWVGASMGFGLKIGATFDGADVSSNFVQSKVIIEGPQNIISGGEIVGDAVSVIDGLTIKGEGTVVASGVKVRQWAGNGISWGATTPAGVLIGQVSFSNNANDIAPLVGFTQTTAPTINGCATDKPRTYTAAATLNIPASVNFALVTGATAIQTIPLRGSGGYLTIQAGVGGITLNNAGNIILPTSPLNVPANSTVTLYSDGAANYFKSV